MFYTLYHPVGFTFQIFRVLNCSLCCYFKVIHMVQFSLFNHISFIIFSHHKKSITQHNVTTYLTYYFFTKKVSGKPSYVPLISQGITHETGYYWIVPLFLSVMVEPWPDLRWHAGEMHSSGMWKVFQWNSTRWNKSKGSFSQLEKQRL